MSLPVVVAGGGIGGLAVATALGRAGRPVRVLEQAPAFTAAGAGLQLGPNAVRLLDAWGLGDGLRERAARPQALVVRDAASGAVLGTLRLGGHFVERYGAPYLTLHRADLHALLEHAARRSGAELVNGVTIENIAETPDSVLTCGQNDSQNAEAAALIGCDGLWSRVREHLLHDGPPQRTGHLAFRAMLPVSTLPAGGQGWAERVSVWLGPQLHVVAYPVRGGDVLNLVAVVHGAPPPGDATAVRSWSQPTDAAALRAALGGIEPDLRELLDAAPGWTLWVLHDRSALPPHGYARGRIALLGDAAHPMRPYLAQGAAMALEDAQTLADCALARPNDWPAAFAIYAERRARRNARVQQRARFNGTVFHAAGWLRSLRNAAMRLRGEALLDSPWLYGGGVR